MALTVPTVIARQTRLILSGLLAVGLLQSQTPASPELRFDVASVKPNRPAACHGRWDFSTSHGTLKPMSFEYGLPNDDIG